jgi:hypothetical protein
MADTTEWDDEMAALLECPDCRGPAAVFSTIDGRTRRIKIYRWHERTCPNKSGHLAWPTESAEAALSTRSLTWAQTQSLG